MITAADLAARLDAVDWDDPRRGPATTREILRSLAANRTLLTELVEAIPGDAAALARCEHHPVMSRLVLAEHPDSLWCLRMHVFWGGERDLIPHTHRRPFGAMILAGGYIHAWHRRTDGERTGPFLASGLTPAIVALETPGSDYSLGDPLVHQTIMEPGTVTLFVSGPSRHDTWWAAEDMGGEVRQMKIDDGRVSFAMTDAAFETITSMLAERGVIDRRAFLPAQVNVEPGPALTETAVPLPVLVSALLQRSGRPEDVPTDQQPPSGGWLPAVAGAALALLADSDPAYAKRSYTGSGHTDLYIGQDGPDCLYLRLQAGNHTVPRQAGNKTAVLTLGGTALLEGYTDQEDVEAGHPQYVREFGPESAYFCYENTPHAVELSDDACQLVVSRGPLARFGVTLTSSEYVDTANAATRILTRALEPAQRPADQLPAGQNG